MTGRLNTIATALRAPNLERRFLGHELRGALVQGVYANSTEVSWSATVPMLAEAIDTALTRAEEKDTPADAGAPSTPHALVLEAHGVDLVGTCRCGRSIGRTPLGRHIDGLIGLWEQHCTQADAAWADALTALPATSNGAS